MHKCVCLPVVVTLKYVFNLKNVHIFKITVMICIAVGRYQLKFCVLLKVAGLKTMIIFYFLIP